MLSSQSPQPSQKTQNSKTIYVKFSHATFEALEEHEKEFSKELVNIFLQNSTYSPQQQYQRIEGIHPAAIRNLSNLKTDENPFKRTLEYLIKSGFLLEKVTGFKANSFVPHPDLISYFQNTDPEIKSYDYFMKGAEPLMSHYHKQVFLLIAQKIEDLSKDGSLTGSVFNFEISDNIKTTQRSIIVDDLCNLNLLDIYSKTKSNFTLAITEEGLRLLGKESLLSGNQNILSFHLTVLQGVAAKMALAESQGKKHTSKEARDSINENRQLIKFDQKQAKIVISSIVKYVKSKKLSKVVSIAKILLTSEFKSKYGFLNQNDFNLLKEEINNSKELGLNMYNILYLKKNPVVSTRSLNTSPSIEKIMDKIFSFINEHQKLSFDDMKEYLELEYNSKNTKDEFIAKALIALVRAKRIEMKTEKEIETNNENIWYVIPSKKDTGKNAKE